MSVATPEPTREYAKRTFRRIVLPLLVLFCLANLLIYLVLNIPFIQRKIVSAINENVLKPYQLELAIDSLYVNLIPTQLVLNQLKITFSKKKPRSRK